MNKGHCTDQVRWPLSFSGAPESETGVFHVKHLP